MNIYRELIEMKYGEGIPTFKLLKQFPHRKRQIHEVALLGVPEGRLRKTVKDKMLLRRILKMKAQFSTELNKAKRQKKRDWLRRLCPWL